MASISRRGNHQYQAIIRRRGYPTQIQTFETRAEAESWARITEAKMDTGHFQDRREIENTTLGQLLQRYVEEVSVKKKGYVAERNRILQLQRHPLAQRPLSSLRAKDFTQYRNERLKIVSENSVRLELAILSHLYTIAIKEWSLPLTHELKNVQKPQPGPGRERRLKGDEEERLRSAISRRREKSTRIWLQACVDLAIQTGMRAGEILTAEWSQVDLVTGVIRLKKTKNGCSRSVPLTQAAIETLQGLPRDIKGKVIPNFYDTSGLDKAFKIACEAADIANLHFHDLRHEAASRLAPNMPAQTLAKVMGWKTIQMAMRYYNPTDEELVEAVRNAMPKQAALTGRCAPTKSAARTGVRGGMQCNVTSITKGAFR